VGVLALGALLVAWTARSIVTGARMARALARDAAAGVVHVFRGRASSDAELSAAVEILPVSRAVWTRGGEQAVWRRAGVDPIVRG
jgi:hypothetical protein